MSRIEKINSGSDNFTLLNFQESTRLLEPIRNLECLEEFKRRNFAPLSRTFCFARVEGMNGRENRLRRIICEDFCLLVVDEAHHSSRLSVRTLINSMIWSALLMRRLFMSKIKKAKTIKELLPIFGQKIEHDSVQTVNARDVWQFLEIKKDFSDWIKHYIKRYDFIEGQDYLRSPNLGSEHKVEYFVSLDMAKELAMVQNNPKGKEARQYFIQCEKIAKTVIEKLIRQRERQLTHEWKQTRESGKIARREATDAIQEFCNFCKSQGSQNSHWYYKSITELIYDAVIIPGGNKEIVQRKKELKKKYGKDTLSLDELIKVELMERFVVKKALKEALDGNKSYKDAYQSLKESLLRYGEMIEKRLSLGMN